MSLRCTTHFHACDCREYEFEKVKRQLEIQTKRVENLKKSNEFYADINNCSTCNEDHHDGVKLPTMSGGLFVTGKFARSCQEIDQELEKELEEVK